MGVYRDAVVALSPDYYLDCSNQAYSTGAGNWYSDRVLPQPGSTVTRLDGSASIRTPGAVAPENGPGFFWDDGSGGATIYFDPNLTAADTTWVYTWAGEDDGIYQTIHFARQQLGPTRSSTWEIYADPSQTNIQIKTFGYWGDLWDPNTLTYGTLSQTYTYDTGIPKAELLDGRPHLIALFAHGENQGGGSTPNPTNTWIKINLDGTDRYTSARGQAWSYSDQDGSSRTLGSNGYALDEVAAWARHLSSTELASLKAVWGGEPPWTSGADPLVSTSSANAPVEVLRYLGGTSSMSAQSDAEMDLAWVEVIGDDFAKATGSAELGSTSWEGADVWIPALPARTASRWLDDTGTALKSRITEARAIVSGNLLTIIGVTGSVAIGRSSVSGQLSVAQRVQGASAGQAQVLGAMGYVYDFAGQSLGSSQVMGEIIVGQAEFIAGAALGVSTVIGDLEVERYSKISGNQADDNWGSGANLPPMGSGRDDGPTRRRFSKNSSGRVTGALT